MGRCRAWDSGLSVNTAVPVPQRRIKFTLTRHRPSASYVMEGGAKLAYDGWGIHGRAQPRSDGSPAVHHRMSALSPLHQDTQACRGALVLSQILKPGLDEEGFHEPVILRDVLKDAPRVGAVAPALFTELLDRGEEWSAVRRSNAVLDRDQNPAMALK